MKYKCEQCGESRFYYSDVSVVAKLRIDLKNGVRDGKVYDIDSDNIDNYFEENIYCGKCNEPVNMELWKDYISDVLSKSK